MQRQVALSHHPGVFARELVSLSWTIRFQVPGMLSPEDNVLVSSRTGEFLKLVASISLRILNRSVISPWVIRIPTNAYHRVASIREGVQCMHEVIEDETAVVLS